MPNSIVLLGTEQQPDRSQIGQKAAVLHQLSAAGFPVPPGLCLTTAAFRQALAPWAEQIRTLCGRADLRDATVAQQVAQQLSTLLDQLVLPPALLAELGRSLPALGNGPLAVRSSATLEDQPNASFAGQYQTVLGLQGVSAVAAAILTCWRSYFTLNALVAQAGYAEQGNMPLAAENAGMAVLIQPLLNAECAGVCFTVDPVQQRAEWLLVTTAWGLGAGVVAGTAPVDTLRVRRFDLSLVENNIADKHSAVRPAPAGGVHLVPVPGEQRRRACLPASWLQRVGQLGLAVEQHLGAPQDIEWAIADQQLWLLQSRPITTLPADVRRATHFPITWANETERQRIWWLVQQNQRPSATLLPAEIEFMKVNTLGGQAAVVIGGSAKTRWRKYVNGRVYMAVADSPVSPAEQRIRSAARQDLLDRLQQQGQTLWDYAGPEVIRATERLDAFDGNQADGPALADHLEDTLAASQRHWLVHTLQPRHSPFAEFLATYGQITGKSPEAAEEDLFFWLQGAETVQTRLIERLYDLAVLAAANPALVAWLQEPAPDRYARRLTVAGAENFWQQFAHLLTLYGGRIGLFRAGLDGQSDVEIPLPWREAPEFLLDMITRYLPVAQGNGAAAPRAAREEAEQRFQARVDALCAAAPDPALAAEFRRRLVYARHNAAFLDDHNHYIDQLSEGQYAQALVYAGRWLAGRGDLPHPYIIFWLHPPEIVAALRATTRQEFGPLWRERQQQFSEWCNLPAPAYIGLPDPHLPPRPALSVSAQVEVEAPSPTLPNLLMGQAASMGQGAGRARIIPALTTLSAIAPGEVLVAAAADPLWMAIFPTLAGIVLDGGGPGDHAAITAREFGIPAVFGTAQATRHIPPNAWVTVDGTTGRVTWE